MCACMVPVHTHGVRTGAAEVQEACAGGVCGASRHVIHHACAACTLRQVYAPCIHNQPGECCRHAGSGRPDTRGTLVGTHINHAHAPRTCTVYGAVYAPRTHTRCGSPPSSLPHCSAAAATVLGAEVAAAKMAAVAAAASSTRQRSSPSRSEVRRTLCSSRATRRRRAARCRSWSRPHYGRCAQCHLAGFLRRLRSRNVRWTRVACRSAHI